MTFEELQIANGKIKTTNIKGKEYAEVKERIIAFRSLFPDGFIRTHIVDLKEGMVVMQAEVGYYDPNGQPILLATGTAYEREKGMINSVSFIENCETSATGRALGMLGFGIDTAIASADEIKQAQAQNQSDVPATEREMAEETAKVERKTIDETKVATLTQKLVELSVPLEKVFKLYKVSSLTDMTVKQWAHAMENAEKIKNVEV